jgi:hypothetical protein
MRRPRDLGLARRETVCESEEERDQQKPEDGMDEELEALVWTLGFVNHSKVDPSLPWHSCGNRSQPTATLFAYLGRFRGRSICHRLPPIATARLHKRSIRD